MKYNPQIHHRRSIRLKGYDYSRAGAYFITICCHKMECRFGHIADAQMILNEYGQIAYNEWAKLPERFPNMELDVFQIMPNHIHGIIILNVAPIRASLADAPASDADADAHNANRAGASPAPTDTATATNATVGNIMGAYKSVVFNACLEIYKSHNETMGKLWHRNYWEHIIRNEQSYQRISQYIIDNPKNWNADKFYKK